MNNKFLSDRMKQYEAVSRVLLTQRMPMIIRVDGRCFHKLTKCCTKPFDTYLHELMVDVARELCVEISGAKLAFIFSDEVSVLVTDYDTHTTQPWFGKAVQKIASVTASIATKAAMQSTNKKYTALTDLPTFDSRCFVVPKEDVCNYFIWRQQDATRNSVLALAQHHFPHKELQELNSKQLQDKLFNEYNVNWNTLCVWEKRGSVLHRQTFDGRGSWVRIFTPIFTQDRNFVEQHVCVE